MPLKFFADHCVSRLIIETLGAEGHEVLRLKDWLPADSPDSIVIEKASELGCILITLNGDFTDIINCPPSRYPGIIALQVKNRVRATSQILDRLCSYLRNHPQVMHYSGKLFIVDAIRIRIRA
jgi:predicted nuclease of predicted toxin-antitoxin system